MYVDIELRRQALEATGWILDARGLWHKPTCVQKDDVVQFPHDCSPYVMPEVESDPGASESWFVDWCEKNGYGWCVYFDRPGVFNCSIVDLVLSRHFAKDATGATPSEARARAVVATVAGRAKPAACAAFLT